MILGGYRRDGGEQLPRVVTVSVAPRTIRRTQSEPLDLLVRFHEEGTCITWQRDVTLRPEREQTILADVAVLDRRATGGDVDPGEAVETAHRLGRALFDAVVGDTGREFLAEHPPTALMVDIDETILDLPWELLRDGDAPLAETIPFGRIVSTRIRPKPERDPVEEDRQLRVLAVLNPTGDVAYMEAEIEALRHLADGDWYTFDVLEGAQATRANLAAALQSGEVDLLHFSGHGRFDRSRPGDSGLRLADGPLATADILTLPWAKPPYFVMASACWGARAARGRRLTSRTRTGNGVAAAFLAAGVSGVAGFYWPVSMRAAAAFTGTFFDQLLEAGSVGEAFRRARARVAGEFEPSGDLGASAAILYGDAATGKRRDLATAS